MNDVKNRKKRIVTRRAFLQTVGGGAAGASVASRLLGKEPRSSQAGPGEMDVFSRKRIVLTVNGKKHSLEVAPNEALLAVLRERLRLTGTKRVCNRGECGACTVHLNGKTVYACHTLAIQADGADVSTIESLAAGDKLHPVQQAFIDKDGYQCGFCTPGFIMASVALLKKSAQPTLDDIKAGLSGNLCRCGNYQKIFAAVAAAADDMRRG